MGGVNTIKKWFCANNKAIPGLLFTLCIAPQLAQASLSADLIQQPVFSCGSGLDKKLLNKDKIFESVPAKPLALSDDGSLLFVVNSQANCLEIYRTADHKLTLASSIEVGVDPVSVAVRSASEVWVVNHISDSVSSRDNCDWAERGLKFLQFILCGAVQRRIDIEGNHLVGAHRADDHRAIGIYLQTGGQREAGLFLIRFAQQLVEIDRCHFGRRLIEIDHVQIIADENAFQFFLGRRDIVGVDRGDQQTVIFVVEAAVK